ncbi:MULTISPECIES: hypothetical protein [unclassified Nonomuraea]|uniref:hypothetical protein n=1 Tax=unclassified Nonomuraea TaxID=2593643 RepID=UPI0033CC4983
MPGHGATRINRPAPATLCRRPLVGGLEVAYETLRLPDGPGLARVITVLRTPNV